MRQRYIARLHPECHAATVRATHIRVPLASVVKEVAVVIVGILTLGDASSVSFRADQLEHVRI